MINEASSYFTLQNTATKEIKEKGSKFIAVSFPIQSRDDFETIILKLKDQYPKATHYCYAYKIGFDGNNYRINDDGEPSGTAGKPIFGQLESYKLTNAAIVVIRYYGGNKLGVTGLIHAYKNASNLSILENVILEKFVEVKFRVTFTRDQYEKMQICIGQLKKYFTELQFLSQYEIIVILPVKQVEELRKIIFETLYGFSYSPNQKKELDNILIELQ